MNILELLRQRRVWAGLIGIISVACVWFKISFNFDIPVLTDLLTSFGGAVSDVVIAGLALWSFLKPKK